MSLLAFLTLLLASDPLVPVAPHAWPSAPAFGEARATEGRIVRTLTFSWPPSPGRMVFVLGDVRELGGGDLRDSVRMVLEEGLWTLRIELPSEQDITYRFLERDAAPSELGNPDNGTVLSEALVLKATREARTRGLLARSSLDRPLLHWRAGSGDPFTTLPLKALGPGRSPEEHLVGASAFGHASGEVEFFLTDRAGMARDPAVGTYRTALARVFLQDQSLYSYVPAPTVSAPRRDYTRTDVPGLWSAILGRERKYRVLLPRGYLQHTARRYPVLYLYDGRHVWDSGSGSEPWDRNGERMASLVNRGVVAEVIQVAIDEPNDLDRIEDTFPPDDRNPFTHERGHADRFLDFLLHELKPLIDATYRTRPEARHTFLQGFSMGGVLALYAGRDFDGELGGVAAQSPALGATPLFRERLLRAEPRRARTYFDMGTLEAPQLVTSLARACQLAPVPWILQRDFEMRLGFGHQHVYSDAGERLEPLMVFLAPARTEPELDAAFEGAGLGRAARRERATGE